MASRTIGSMVVLLAFALAGCVGGDEAPPETDGPTDEDSGTGEDPGSDDEEPAPINTTLETWSYTFSGTGTGWGVLLPMDLFSSQFWLISENYVHDLEVPDTFEAGTIMVRWDAALHHGGLDLWLDDPDGSDWRREFTADASPTTIELGPDDERLLNVTAFLVVSDNTSTPATLHVDTEWTAEFTFDVLVPSD